MAVTYKDGSIIYNGSFAQEVKYDAGNMLLNAQFDGRGGINRYAVINKFETIDSLYTMISVNGMAYDYSGEKKVTMTGKKTVIEFSFSGAEFTITQFLAGDKNAALTEISATATGGDAEISAVINFGVNYTSYMKEMLLSRFSVKNLIKAASGLLRKHIIVSEKCVRNNLLGDFYIDLACNNKLIPLESNAFFCNQYKSGISLKKGETKFLRFAFSSGTRKDFSYCDAESCIDGFDGLLLSAGEYLSVLRHPNTDASEHEKAFYASCLNCALSNYKEKGKFKGFLAGIVYQFPARTYYRDGYWTALPVMKTAPKLVRNQIITLSYGINEKGKCPSAVKSNFKSYWGNHYDSPSFFVILLYDYINHTGDMDILFEKTKKGNILDAAVRVMARLAEETDGTGLLVKGGEYNRRDWCDNVFRGGYVTYDEALYARALHCLSVMLEKTGNSGWKEYKLMYEKAKASINQLLWDEEKGYFVNFKDGNFTEDNLSVDTVVIALYNLSTPERIGRMLKNMENLLESKNNKEQAAGDYGVLSVYPFYKNSESTVLKSSLPYFYHNGGDWPYLSAAYAYAKLAYGMDYKYPLTRWFDYNIDKGNFTPIEFFSPYHPEGSLMQGWSAMGALAHSFPDGTFFEGRFLK